jgi:uncharacterized membrane protein
MRHNGPESEGGRARHGGSRRVALGVVREERLVATFENTVLIARPIEDVFAFLSDLENVPKWNYAISLRPARSPWGR